MVFVEKLPQVDWKRFWSFVAIGFFLSGPGLHYWYGALPRIVTVPGLAGVLLRIALDQVIFTALGMYSFFVVLLTLENRQDELLRKLQKVPAAGLLGMVWSVFISYKGHT